MTDRENGELIPRWFAVPPKSALDPPVTNFQRGGYELSVWTPNMKYYSLQMDIAPPPPRPEPRLDQGWTDTTFVRSTVLSETFNVGRLTLASGYGRVPVARGGSTSGRRTRRVEFIRALTFRRDVRFGRRERKGAE
jgi:hypothetical protein